MKNKDHLYLLLGLDRSATMDEVKKAYRRLSKKHHPDKDGDPEVFREIAAAFKVLSNPQSRARYDQTGETAPHPDLIREAGAIMANLVIQLIAQYPKELKYMDLVGEMRFNLKKNLEDIDENRKKLTKELRRIIQVERRLSQNDSEAPPFLAGALKERREVIVLHLRQIPHAKAVFAKALELMDDYSYRFEEQVSSITFRTYFGGTASTTGSW